MSRSMEDERPRRAGAAGTGRRRTAAQPDEARRRGRRAPRRGRLGRLARLLIWALVACIWLSLALAGVVAFYAYDLPDVSRIADDKRQPGVRLLDAADGQLASFGQVYGEAISVAALPPHLPQAVIAIEDHRFYAHFGLDAVGLVRALVANLRAGRIVQGGSTITQQLAKNLFLGPERTLKRKVQELLLALWLEHRLSKDQILSLYLNRVYLGAGTYGVDAAARRYFGKSARKVDLYEAALLAGLLKAPSRYNPARDPDLADRRARLVLDAMVEHGFLAAEQAAAAGRSGAPVRATRARYFADWVLGRAGSYLGAIGEDLVVRTTLDARLQTIAEEETMRLLEGPGGARGVTQAAVVVLAPGGAVRAMVGGRSHRDSQFNRAVQALRQPGSAFKLFVYLAGLEGGLAPETRLADAPVSVATAQGRWEPRNYGDRYYGEVTLRESFARSLNSVAVRVFQRAGAEQVAATASRLGISSALETTPSLALGASEVSLLELTAAYGVLANDGRGVWPYGIEQIKTPGGRVLYRREGRGPGRVLAARELAAMTDLLRAVVVWGTGKTADPGRPAAGKSGTSQDFRDAWFVGYTAELVVGVWLGNDDGRPMQEVTGGSLPAALWRAIVTRALQDEPAQPLPAARSVPLAQEEKPPGGALQRILRRLLGDGETPPAEHKPRRFGDDGYRG